MRRVVITAFHLNLGESVENRRQQDIVRAEPRFDQLQGLPRRGQCFGKLPFAPEYSSEVAKRHGLHRLSAGAFLIQGVDGTAQSGCRAFQIVPRNQFFGVTQQINCRLSGEGEQHQCQHAERNLCQFW